MADEGGGRHFDEAGLSGSLVPYTSSHSSGLYMNCSGWSCWEGHMVAGSYTVVALSALVHVWMSLRLPT